MPVEAFESCSSMRQYRRTLLPRVDADFIREADSAITQEQQNALRKLLDFRRNPRHNWNEQRLTMVEKMVSEQVKNLLE